MCLHEPPYPANPPSIGDCWRACRLANVGPGRANTTPTRGADGNVNGDLTRIDAAFFRSLDDAGKAALIAHERAHSLMGLDVECESCADKVGGYLMRTWRWSPQACASGMRKVAGEFRADAGDMALVGAREAEKFCAGQPRGNRRGLAGIVNATASAPKPSLQLTLQTPALTPSKPKPKPGSFPSLTITTPSTPQGSQTPTTTTPGTKPAGGFDLATFFDQDFAKLVVSGVLVVGLAAVVFRGGSA